LDVYLYNYKLSLEIWAHTRWLGHFYANVGKFEDNLAVFYLNLDLVSKIEPNLDLVSLVDQIWLNWDNFEMLE
jgi:hypothetical protein